MLPFLYSLAFWHFWKSNGFHWFVFMLDAPSVEPVLCCSSQMGVFLCCFCGEGLLQRSVQKWNSIGSCKQYKRYTSFCTSIYPSVQHPIISNTLFSPLEGTILQEEQMQLIWSVLILQIKHGKAKLQKHFTFYCQRAFILLDAFSWRLHFIESVFCGNKKKKKSPCCVVFVKAVNSPQQQQRFIPLWIKQKTIFTGDS